jgi:hypothetical protein
MKTTTRIAALATGACIIVGGLTIGASAADAGTPTGASGTVSYSSVLAQIQAAIAGGATPNAAPAPIPVAHRTRSTRTRSTRTRSTRSTRTPGAAPSLTTSALALAAEIYSGVRTPCQFNADEPGSLLVFGNYPGETYVVAYLIHGVPVELKTGKLTTRGTSLKAVPRDFSTGDVRVWAGGTRCSHT